MITRIENLMAELTRIMDIIDPNAQNNQNHTVLGVDRLSNTSSNYYNQTINYDPRKNNDSRELPEFESLVEEEEEGQEEVHLDEDQPEKALITPNKQKPQNQESVTHKRRLDRNIEEHNHSSEEGVANHIQIDYQDADSQDTYDAYGSDKN